MFTQLDSSKTKKKRASTRRSRAGCQTCRQRHMRCDEAKPSCRNCVVAGWKCDSHESLERDALQCLNIVNYAIPFRVPGSQKDRQALHYYCTQGSTDLAGYLNSDFWSQVVLEASHHDSIVRQALVSLSLLHLEPLVDKGPRAIKNEALVRYGKALNALNQKLQDPSNESVRTSLICCVLFYCFEILQGQSENAMNHLESGLRILSQYRVHYLEHREREFITLHRVFQRMDLQATFFDQEREPVLAAMIEAGLWTATGKSLSAQLTLAHNNLVVIQSSLFRFLVRNASSKDLTRETIPTTILEEKAYLMDRLDEWKVAATRLEVSIAGDGRLVNAFCVLVVQWHVCRMLLVSGHPLDDTVFHASPNAEAMGVLDLISDMFASQAREHTTSKEIGAQRNTCSAETGVVAPLFILCMKCSDIAVRKRAAGLLEMAGRREGLYDSRSMLAMINRFEHHAQVPGKQVATASLEDYIPAALATTSGTMDRLADLLGPYSD